MFQTTNQNASPSDPCLVDSTSALWSAMCCNAAVEFTRLSDSNARATKLPYCAMAKSSMAW